MLVYRKNNPINIANVITKPKPTKKNATTPATSKRANFSFFLGKYRQVTFAIIVAKIKAKTKANITTLFSILVKTNIFFPPHSHSEVSASE